MANERTTSPSDSNSPPLRLGKVRLFDPVASTPIPPPCRVAGKRLRDHRPAGITVHCHNREIEGVVGARCGSSPSLKGFGSSCPRMTDEIAVSRCPVAKYGRRSVIPLSLPLSSRESIESSPITPGESFPHKGLHLSPLFPNFFPSPLFFVLFRGKTNSFADCFA